MFSHGNAGLVFYIFIKKRSAIRAADFCFLSGSILIDRLIVSVIRCRDGLSYDIVILIAVTVIGVQISKADWIFFSLLAIIRCILNSNKLHILRICPRIAVQFQLGLRTK